MNAPLELPALFKEVVNSRQLVRLRELLVYINTYIDNGEEAVHAGVVI